MARCPAENIEPAMQAYKKLEATASNDQTSPMRALRHNVLNGTSKGLTNDEILALAETCIKKDRDVVSERMFVFVVALRVFAVCSNAVSSVDMDTLALYACCCLLYCAV